MVQENYFERILNAQEDNPGLDAINLFNSNSTNLNFGERNRLYYSQGKLYISFIIAALAMSSKHIARMRQAKKRIDAFPVLMYYLILSVATLGLFVTLASYIDSENSQTLGLVLCFSSLSGLHRVLGGVLLEKISYKMTGDTNATFTEIVKSVPEVVRKGFPTPKIEVADNQEGVNVKEEIKKRLSSVQNGNNEISIQVEEVTEDAQQSVEMSSKIVGAFNR